MPESNSLSGGRDSLALNQTVILRSVDSQEAEAALRPRGAEQHGTPDTGAPESRTAAEEPQVVRSSAAVQKDLGSLCSPLPVVPQIQTIGRKAALTAELMKATAADMGKRPRLWQKRPSDRRQERSRRKRQQRRRSKAHRRSTSPRSPTARQPDSQTAKTDLSQRILDAPPIQAWRHRDRTPPGAVGQHRQSSIR